jgi:hypothetical protein
MERAASTVSVAAVQAARPSSVRKVGFWHLWDMPTGRDDVCFRVKTGSRGQTGKMTRMTRTSDQT